MGTTVDIYRLRLSKGEHPIVYKWFPSMREAETKAKVFRLDGWNVVINSVGFPTRKHSIVSMLTYLEQNR